MAMALALVSAHLRLVNSGLGCAEWPQCYGRIGAPASSAAPVENDTGAARLAHRVLASALGIVVLLVVAANLRRHGTRIAAGLLLLVTLGLAALGKHSAGLEQPAVVMANYSGGMILVASLWWLRNSVAAPRSGYSPSLRRWSLFCLAALSVQLLSGGLVSAYFAGLACGPSIDCNGHWLPDLPWDVISTFFGHLALDDTGTVAMGRSLSGLHMAHRIGGVALVAILAWLAWSLHQSGRSRLACTILALTSAAALAGVLAVRMQLPHGMVLSHYTLALALLLATLTAVATGRASRHDGADMR
ncbi:MAG: COX15/CtaA family protein [Rhodocyclales bacterium]|nr:COX15/CtaA family protein [Rhodocyclales bacterium]